MEQSRITLIDYYFFFKWSMVQQLDFLPVHFAYQPSSGYIKCGNSHSFSASFLHTKSLGPTWLKQEEITSPPLSSDTEITTWSHGDPFQWSEMCLNETISQTLKAVWQFSWSYYWNNLLLLFSFSWFDFITAVWLRVTAERACRLASLLVQLYLNSRDYLRGRQSP